MGGRGWKTKYKHLPLSSSRGALVPRDTDSETRRYAQNSFFINFCNAEVEPRALPILDKCSELQPIPKNLFCLGFVFWFVFGFVWLDWGFGLSRQGFFV